MFASMHLGYAATCVKQGELTLAVFSESQCHEEVFVAHVHYFSLSFCSEVLLEHKPLQGGTSDMRQPV